MEARYKVGDRVRVVHYGHAIWEHKSEDISVSSFPIIQQSDEWIVRDMSPEMIGREGIVKTVSLAQGKPSYALSEIKGKAAWYNEDQLELVDKKSSKVWTPQN